MKPLYKWSGGKRQEIARFEQYYPEMFSTFVEPFFGAGAVYFDMLDRPQAEWVDFHINDLHDEVFTFMWVMKFRRLQLLEELAQPHFQNTESQYYFIRDKYDWRGDKVKTAARFFYLRKTCFRGMIRYSGSGDNLKFNIPYGRYKNEFSFENLQDKKLPSFLHKTDMTHLDFEVVMNYYADNPDAFIFLDPPYDSVFKKYKTDFSHDDQVRLANCFKKSQAKCLMVIGATSFIRELYDGYIVDEYHKKYLFKIKEGRVKADAMHLVIANYD